MVRQNDSYDRALMLTQTSAATVAPSRNAALPVSVRRNRRSGVTSRAQSVDPICRTAGIRDSVIHVLSGSHRQHNGLIKLNFCPSREGVNRPLG